MDGYESRIFLIGMLSPFGGGVMLLAAASEGDSMGEYRALVLGIAKTVKFFKPEPNSDVEQWIHKLTGARLTYIWSDYRESDEGSYQAGCQEIRIDLSPQGSFKYLDRKELAGEGHLCGGDGASDSRRILDKGQGHWEVIGRDNESLLQLIFADERVFEYVLSAKEGKTYLDNKRFFLTYGDVA